MTSKPQAVWVAISNNGTPHADNTDDGSNGAPTLLKLARAALAHKPRPAGGAAGRSLNAPCHALAGDSH
jgi:hypothetical protein